MGCAQLLLGGSRPDVRQPSSRDGSNEPATTALLYAVTVPVTALASSPRPVATAPMSSATTGGYIGGRNRRFTFASQIEYAICPGCPAMFRPQIAYRLGHSSSPSS